MISVVVADRQGDDLSVDLRPHVGPPNLGSNFFVTINNVLDKMWRWAAESMPYPEFSAAPAVLCRYDASCYF